MQTAYVLTCRKGIEVALEKSGTDKFYHTYYDAKLACKEINKSLGIESFSIQEVVVMGKRAFNDIIKIPNNVTPVDCTGFVVDVETDGPIPGDYNMIEIGAVKLDRELKTTFYAKLAPISINYRESSLKSIGKTIESIWDGSGIYPVKVMLNFMDWINENSNNKTPVLFSDNNGFDSSFINYYFNHCGIDNPFGHTSRNIADIFRGLTKNFKANFKKLRDTKHTHDPVSDAMGNAEALIKFIDQYGLKGFPL